MKIHSCNKDVCKKPSCIVTEFCIVGGIFFPSSHPTSALLSLSGMVVICLEGIQLQHFVSREYYRSAKTCPVAYLGAKLGAASLPREKIL